MILRRKIHNSWVYQLSVWALPLVLCKPSSIWHWDASVEWWVLIFPSLEHSQDGHGASAMAMGQVRKWDGKHTCTRHFLSGYFTCPWWSRANWPIPSPSHVPLPLKLLSLGSGMAPNPPSSVLALWHGAGQKMSCIFLSGHLLNVQPDAVFLLRESLANTIGSHPGETGCWGSSLGSSEPFSFGPGCEVPPFLWALVHWGEVEMIPLAILFLLYGLD